jgi:hypothetical protein
MNLGLDQDSMPRRVDRDKKTGREGRFFVLENGGAEVPRIPRCNIVFARVSANDAE